MNAQDARNARRSRPAESARNATTMLAIAVAGSGQAQRPARAIAANIAGRTNPVAATVGRATTSGTAARHATFATESCRAVPEATVGSFQARYADPCAARQHHREQADGGRVRVDRGHAVPPHREKVEVKPAARTDGYAAHDVAERDPRDERQHAGREREHRVPRGAPERMRHVASELDGHPSEDQQPENDDERQVHPAHRRGVRAREREQQHPAGGHEPDLVAVPHRQDRGERAAALLFAPRDDAMDEADAEVEAVEHGPRREHHADDREEDGGQFFRPSPARARERFLGRRGTRRASRAAGKGP